MLTIFFLLLSCTNLVKLPPINNIYSGTIKIPIIGTHLGSGAGYANGGFAIAIILALIIYRKSVYKI